MAEEYIKRSDVLEIVLKCSDGYRYIDMPTENLFNLVKAIPAEDVAPVRHSFWELIGECKDGNKVEMSRCRCVKCGFIHWFADNHFGQYMFCPQCGARMDGE